jgi:hypothetical protein
MIGHNSLYAMSPLSRPSGPSAVAARQFAQITFIYASNYGTISNEPGAQGRDLRSRRVKQNHQTGRSTEIVATQHRPPNLLGPWDTPGRFRQAKGQETGVEKGSQHGER